MKIGLDFFKDVKNYRSENILKINLLHSCNWKFNLGLEGRHLSLAEFWIYTIGEMLKIICKLKIYLTGLH